VSFELRVAGVRRATSTARIVRVALGAVPFQYKAGQVAMIGPAGGTARVPYSIASAPEETERHGWLEFLIKTDDSGEWGDDFPPLRPRMMLAVDGPFGSFTFPDHPRERRFLFIAGGTGVSPIRSMIRHLVLTGRQGRIRLLYSARTPGDFAYTSEFRKMAGRAEIELALTATREIPARWKGSRGRVSAAQLAELVDDSSTLCFICGPASMVEEVPPMLRRLGIDESRIHVEKW
jgi:ferredoxin-NADP reductase